MLKRTMIWTAILLCALPACGDDDDTVNDAGVDGGGNGNAGRSGASGRAGSAGKAGSSGRGGAGGSAGRAAAGSGGSSAGSGGSNAAKTEKVAIKFKAKIGADDFACGTPANKQGSTNATVQPRDFRFFVQDLKLIANDDSEVPVTLDTRSPWQNKDVALLDFEDNTGDCSSGDSMTNAEVTGTVPTGEYKGIVFSNGVPESVNHGDPVELEPPLRQSPLTWGWLFGHVFFKVEVASAIDDAEVAGGIIHVGSTGCTNATTEDAGVDDFEAPPTITCSKPNRNKIKLLDYQLGTSVIVVDAEKLFRETNLSQASDCHSAGDACGPLFKALGVDFDTGSALSTQSVYRLE